MAFFRFSRDKRGYEYFYLVEPVTNRRGKTRQRVLYWYRTPPNVRVGRAPFDEDVQRALETQYPDVTFDWRKIVDAPIPSPDVEKWRDRRRAEKAEKAARQLAVSRAAEERVEAAEPGEEGAEAKTLADASASAAEPVKAGGLGTPEQPYRITSDQIRKRRRRRRGRGQRPESGTVTPSEAQNVSTSPGGSAASDAAGPGDDESSDRSGE
jgi:hypothetical protein